MTLEELAKVSGLAYPTVAGIENNKTSPSLNSLDALARALEISTSDLVSLSENHEAITRETETVKAEILRDLGQEFESLLVANFDKCKVFRAKVKAGNVMKTMKMHEGSDSHEIFYVLEGSVDIRVNRNNYKLNQNEVILFDGTIDHDYTIISDIEAIVIHIPQDTRIIDALLKPKYAAISQ